MTRATSSSSQSIINQPGQSPQLAPLSQPPITPGKILRNTKLETKLKLGSTTTPVSKSAMTVPTYGSDQYDKQWHVIKHWSRKQIERSVKGLINRLYSANCSVPSPAEISQFVRLALTNPSSSVLYPHLVSLFTNYHLTMYLFKYCKTIFTIIYHIFSIIWNI